MDRPTERRRVAARNGAASLERDVVAGLSVPRLRWDARTRVLLHGSWVHRPGRPRRTVARLAAQASPTLAAVARVMSEGSNQNRIREHYAQMGARLWRNNSGVLTDVNGRPVRYGLANDSRQLNEQIKSGDLIGWWPRLITPDMVGGVFAQFLSIEAKPDGWTMPSDRAMGEAAKRARAQLRWSKMVRDEGGQAGFMIDPLRGFEPY